MTKSSHRYTAEGIRERFTAAIGKTAGELDTKGILSGSTAYKNKGRIGAVIEQSVLGYPADNRQEPDLVIDETEWELKTTGLIAATRSDSWRAKGLCQSPPSHQTESLARSSQHQHSGTRPNDS